MKNPFSFIPKRLRVRIAVWFCGGTDCMVARAGSLTEMQSIANRLGSYVEASRALQDPRRVKAYRVVYRAARGLMEHVAGVLVGPINR